MSDFKAKMHQILFWLGLHPRPRWGSLQRSPDPLAGFKGATSRQGGEGKGMEKWRGMGRDGKTRVGKGEKGNGGGKGKGKWEGREGHGMGKGKEEGEGKGGEGLQLPKL